MTTQSKTSEETLKHEPQNNAPPGAGLGALVLGFFVTAIGMSMGWISGSAISLKNYMTGKIECTDNHLDIQLRYQPRS